MPLCSASMLVEDVARAHIDPIQPSIPGNADYFYSSGAPEGSEWNKINDNARKYFNRTLPTSKFNLTSSVVENVFGSKFMSLEEMTSTLIGQYVDLKKKK